MLGLPKLTQHPISAIETALPNHPLNLTNLFDLCKREGQRLLFSQ